MTRVQTCKYKNNVDRDGGPNGVQRHGLELVRWNETRMSSGHLSGHLSGVLRIHSVDRHRAPSGVGIHEYGIAVRRTSISERQIEVDG
jgi:hypothetical protein